MKIVTLNDLKKFLVLMRNSFTPVGTISAFAGETSPTGYLLCNGSEISRKEYKNLFEVIGTTYGKGDNSTTFNLPDLREVALVGIGIRENGVTNHDEYTLGQFKNDIIINHSHEFTPSGTVSNHSHGMQHYHGASASDVGVSVGFNAGWASYDSGYPDIYGVGNQIREGTDAGYRSLSAGIHSHSISVGGALYVGHPEWGERIYTDGAQPSFSGTKSSTGGAGNSTINRGKRFGVNYIIKF